MLWCQNCKEALNDGNKDGNCSSRPEEAGHVIRDQKKLLKVVCEDPGNHKKVI